MSSPVDGDRKTDDHKTSFDTASTPLSRLYNMLTSLLSSTINPHKGTVLERPITISQQTYDVTACARDTIEQVRRCFPQGLESHPVMNRVLYYLHMIANDPSFFRKHNAEIVDCIVTTEGAGHEHGGHATDPDEMLALSILGFLLNIGAIDRIRLVGDPKIANSDTSAKRFLVEVCHVDPSKVIACPAGRVTTTPEMKPLPGSTTIAFGLAAASGLPEILSEGDRVFFMGDHPTHTNPSRDPAAFEKILDRPTTFYINRTDTLLEKRGIPAGLFRQLGFPKKEIDEAVGINMRNALAFATTCSFPPAIANRWRPHLIEMLGLQGDAANAVAPRLIALCQQVDGNAPQASDDRPGKKVQRPYILALARFVFEHQQGASLKVGLLSELTDEEVRQRLDYFGKYFDPKDFKGKAELITTLDSLTPDARRVVLASQMQLLKDLADLNFVLPKHIPVPQTLEQWKALEEYLVITPYDPATVADGAWMVLAGQEPTMLHPLGGRPMKSVDEGIAITLTFQLLAQKMAEHHARRAVTGRILARL